MPRFAVLLALVAAASSPLLADLSPQAGGFLFQNYVPRDYSANQQNWSAVQDNRGILYFANTDCVLEYDGVTWRKIPLTSTAAAVALAIDSRGTIFVGGQGIFGYLTPGPQGENRFVSLLDKVGKSDLSFTEVYDVLPTSDGVYFAANTRVFLYTSGGELRTFRPAGSETFGRAFTYQDEVYITSSRRGLLTIRSRELVPSTIRVDPELVLTNLRFAAGPQPLLAIHDKLYRFSLVSFDPFPTAADNYFKEHRIYSLRQLPSGDVAVGTSNGGLVLLNQKGELERIIRKADGLPSDWISFIYADRQGGVWITTDGGLSRFSTDLTQMQEHQGLHGNVYAVARLNDILYAGTALGLFKMRAVSGVEPLFEPVPAVQELVPDIKEHVGRLFVCSAHGVTILSGAAPQHIGKRLVYTVGFSPQERDVFYAAGREGLQKFRLENNQWLVVSSVPNQGGSGNDFQSVVESPDGQVWATTRNAIWRVDFSSNSAKTERFEAAQGVPPDYKYVYLFRGHVVFATAKGLLRFDSKTRRFLPDYELGKQFADGSHAVSNIREDAANNVWITGNGYHGILHHELWFGEPLLQTGLGELFAMYLDKDGTCWASGASGLLYRLQGPPRLKFPNFKVLIRDAILTNQGTALFGGDGTAPQMRLPFRDNALRFEYAAPFFEDEGAVEYQYWLDGSEKQWSPWTKEPRKDYTNLPEGSYAFSVRARNPHGDGSPAEIFAFTIRAPWYRTWWAYLLYIAGLLYAGWLILRWRLQALEAKNRWLESVVEERTAEVRSERDQNEALLLNILPKPVAAELRTTGSVKPTSFEDVTVCFSDFVGFTLSSEKLPPEELITSLNEYFTAFDEIIGRYGLEKLKTIGDAYMFAGGLPNATPSHAVDSVLAALEMVEAVRKLAKPEKGINWSIRLGLYSGPVMAGVVGVRKFAFDIWGNTVNFASRMESAGSANRVNLSATTCSRVSDFIECEPRGLVRIKEGREMEMYFACGLKPELLDGPLVDGIPQTFKLRYEEAFSRSPKTFPQLNGIHVF